MTEPTSTPPQQPDAAPTNPNDAGEKLELTSPEEARSLKDFLLWAGVILLAVLSAYSPALHGKFIWDDDRHVEQNPALRTEPRSNGLLNIWTGHPRKMIWGDEKRVPVFTPQYYPLTHTTFWLEYQLSGATPGNINTTVFHVTKPA